MRTTCNGHCECVRVAEGDRYNRASLVQGSFMRHLLLAWVLAFVLPAAHAQMRIDVSGVGATQYPIAIAGFAADSRVPQQVADIVRSDLTRSGAFRVIDPQVTLSDTATPDYASMRARGADAVLGGSVARLADGRYDIRYRLGDAGCGKTSSAENRWSSARTTCATARIGSPTGCREDPGEKGSFRRESGPFETGNRFV